MNQHWVGLIDQTLQSTNDTIKRLKERQAHYDAAKKRVSHAFANGHRPFSSAISPVSESHGRDFFSSENEEGPSKGSVRATSDGSHAPELKLPPPLPPSIVDYMPINKGNNTYMPFISNNTQSSLQSLHPSKGLSGLPELADAYRVVESQLRSVKIELELERRVRADHEHELSARLSNHISEINGMFRQLKMENNQLKESVRALESERSLSNALSQPPSGTFPTSPESKIQTQTSWLEDSSVKQLKVPSPSANLNKSSILPIATTLHNPAATANYPSSCSLSALLQRVEDLETSFQRQAFENRQKRIDSVIHETVENKIRIESERLRSVARETACASTESLMQLRLHAMQSMFQSELQKVLESTGVLRELSQANDRMFRNREQDWNSKWEEIQNRLREVEGATKSIENSVVAGVEKNLRQDVESVRQEFLSLRDETRESKGLLVQEYLSKIEAGRVEVMSAVQSVLDEQRNSDRHREETQLRHLIDSAIDPLHIEIEQVQYALRSVREAGETGVKQVNARLDTLEKVEQLHQQDVAELQQMVTSQPSTVEELRVQLSECVQRQQRLEAEMKELHTLATSSSEHVRLQANQHVEQRAQLDAQLRRVQQTQEGLSKRLHAAELSQEEQQQRLGQLAENVGSLELDVSRSLQPTAQKLANLQQTVYKNCLPQIESLQQEMLDARTRWQQLHDGRTYHEKLVAQLLTDARKDSEARLEELEARVRDDVEVTKLQSKDIIKNHATALDSIRKAVETNTAALSLNENAQKTIAESIQRLEKRLASMEALSASNADAQHSVSHATATLLDKKIDALERCLRSREKEDLKMLDLQTELGRVDAEQSRLVQSLEALQEQFFETLGKVRHEAQLQDTTLKEHVLTTVSKSEDRTLQHMNDVLKSTDDRLKELVLPSRLVHRIVTESSALTLLAQSLLPHLGLANEALTDLDKFQDALRRLSEQQEDLIRRLVCLEERGHGMLLSVASGAHTPDNKRKTQETTEEVHGLEESVNALLEPTRMQYEQLKEQFLGHRTACDEATCSLTIKVAALEARERVLTDTYSHMQKCVSNRLQATEEAWREDHDYGLQRLQTRLHHLEESHARLEETSAELAETARKALAEAEQHDRQHKEQAEKSAKLESLVLSRLEEVYRDMVEWHQNQLATLEQRLTVSASQQESRSRAFQEEIERRLRGCLKPFEANPASELLLRNGKEKVNKSVANAADAVNDVGIQLDQLERRMDVLEQQLGGVATSSEVGLKGTADALAGLRDALAQCVQCVVCELRNDDLMLRIIAGEEVGISSTVGRTDSPIPVPKLEALNEVFILLMRQLSYACRGLSMLQENALATLELVEQQQMGALAIPTLQEVVLALVAYLRRVVEAFPELGECDMEMVEKMVRSTMGNL